MIYVDLLKSMLPAWGNTPALTEDDVPSKKQVGYKFIQNDSNRNKKINGHWEFGVSNYFVNYIDSIDNKLPKMMLCCCVASIDVAAVQDRHIDTSLLVAHPKRKVKPNPWQSDKVQFNCY